MRFRNNIIHDDVDHSARGEGQRVGKDGHDEGDEEGAQDAGHGLHQAAQLTVPDGTSRGETGRFQWEAHSQALGEVLDANPDGKISAMRIVFIYSKLEPNMQLLPGALESGGGGLPDRAEADADSEPLGDVVHGYGDDEEEDPLPVLVLVPLPLVETDGKVTNALLGGITTCGAMSPLSDTDFFVF